MLYTHIIGLKGQQGPPGLTGPQGARGFAGSRGPRRETEDSKAFRAKLVDKALWDLLAARVRRGREE